MTKLIPNIAASLLLFWLSFAFAKDQTKPGIILDASEAAGGETGLVTEPGRDYEQSELDALPNRPDTDAPSPLAEQEKETDDNDAQTCLHCNEGEQLVVDLNYYKQITDILKGINENYEDINESTRKSIHSMVAKTNPGLIDLLFKSAEQEMPEQEMPEQEMPRQIVPRGVNYSAMSPIGTGQNEQEQLGEIHWLKEELANLRQELRIMEDRDSAQQKNNKPRQNTTGIDGLMLKHVNEENPVTGAQARIVVGSHYETKYLSLNSTFTHNENEYIVKAIEKQGDNSRDHLHLVFIENTETGEIHNIPW